jgi:hypothetical protein
MKGAKNATISGGFDNCVLCAGGAIVGGCDNAIRSASGFVGGGTCNIICTSSNCSVIGGGQLNCANACFTFIGGGCCNVTNSRWSVISSGHRNIIQSPTNECCSFGVTIGGGIGHNSTGGSFNTTTGDLTGTITCCNAGRGSTIGGGYRNCGTGYFSFIGGGRNNTSSNSDSTIGGGTANVATADRSTIAGGVSNSVMGAYSFIGGGTTNTASGYASTIGGGSSNTASCTWATIAGGWQNTASAARSTVGGGRANRVCPYGYNSVIGGGYYNLICGHNSSILGGQYNTVNSSCYNVHIIGSSLTGNYSNTTFTNCLRVCGAFYKSTGYFSIPHPNPSKTDTFNLLHSFVESPTEGDNIYRFVIDIVDGYGEVVLPDYYKFLNKNSQVWISPVNGFGIGYGEINEEDTKVIIKANMDIKYNVLVIGTRKDDFVKKNWKGVERKIQKPKIK